MSALIEAKNITKIYKDGETETTVLRGISLTIEKGEFVTIMGPSGSGKSTLLHILGLLDDLSGGEYIFDGKNINSYTEVQTAKMRNDRIGFVFQAFNLLARTSVLENVKLPLLYSGVEESEWNGLAREALQSVGLSHREKHEPGELSGGEKQRVAIARALVTKPDVIFADEPTGNLDSKSGAQVMQILQKLHDEKGHTIILITHETATASHAERIIHILDGEIESDKEVVNRLRAEASFVK
ncbi:MAG: ABC transporter ATP-binding protein [Candidatus Taylorbacteria bacterium]